MALKLSPNTTVGKLLLSRISQTNDISTLASNPDMVTYLIPGEVEAFMFMHQFLKKHGAVPKMDTIKTHTGVSLVPCEEPVDYYLSLVKTRYVKSEVVSIMQAVHASMQDNTPPEEVLAEMVSRGMGLKLNTVENKIFDYRKSAALLHQQAKEAFYLGHVGGLETGWKTYDDMAGGLMPGDMMSVVGRPASGKSWLLIWMAFLSWLKGNPVLLVSMEMSPLLIMQRLSSIDTKTSMTKLKTKGLLPKELDKYFDALKANEAQEHGFFVLDGNLSSTVEDIWLSATVLKPKSIWLDGGYLVKHPTERDRFRRVAENADLMKQNLSPLAPTCVSWQFAKPPKGSKKGETNKDLSGDDIGYSDAILQVSSTAIGIMQEESVETIETKRAKILKGRNGEVGEFTINWQFDPYPDFSEKEDEQVENLSYL